MRKNLDRRLAPLPVHLPAGRPADQPADQPADPPADTAACSPEAPRGPRPSVPGQAQRLRELLAAFLARAAAGSLRVHVGPAGELNTRSNGHFHLAPELFLQVGGSTLFRFPESELLLPAGEALVLPPKLLHAEQVRADGPEAPFCNLVVYAEGPSLSCHLAHEVAAGKPGILHLEACRHTQAPRIQEWLGDAARLARAAPDEARRAGGPSTDIAWASAQVRALVSAATAGVLRALDDAAGAAPEPALVAKLRVLVQNQLGDHQLSVVSLAQQSGCTADYLSHVFSRSTGEHLVAYINRLRMERAARLLRESPMAGKEVAWACGYATQSYFIRSFRGHHGVTPNAWRAGRGSAA